MPVTLDDKGTLEHQLQSIRGNNGNLAFLSQYHRVIFRLMWLDLELKAEFREA